MIDSRHSQEDNSMLSSIVNDMNMGEPAIM
jgi:hypothetical protein